MSKSFGGLCSCRTFVGSIAQGRPPSSGSHSSPRTRLAHDAKAGSGTCVHGEPPRTSGRTGKKKRMKQVKSGWVLPFSPAGCCGVDLAFICSLQIEGDREQWCFSSLLNHVGFPPMLFWVKCLFSCPSSKILLYNAHFYCKGDFWASWIAKKSALASLRQPLVRLGHWTCWPMQKWNEGPTKEELFYLDCLKWSIKFIQLPSLPQKFLNWKQAAVHFPVIWWWQWCWYKKILQHVGLSFFPINGLLVGEVRS